MALKSGFEEWPGDGIGIVCQQLRLHPVDPWRLLQRLDDMSQKFYLDQTGVRQEIALRDVKVADDPLAAFIDEKGVSEDAAAIDGGIAWQNLGIYVAQNHLRRTGVVPGEQPSPELRFVFEQWAQVN